MLITEKFDVIKEPGEYKGSKKTEGEVIWGLLATDKLGNIVYLVGENDCCEETVGEDIFGLLLNEKIE